MTPRPRIKADRKPPAAQLHSLFRRFRASIGRMVPVVVTYEDPMGWNIHQQSGFPHGIFNDVLHLRQGKDLLVIPLCSIYNIERKQDNAA